MNKHNLLFFHSWFNNYVNSFYSEGLKPQENIKHKEEHTRRVCKNIVLIGKSINLERNELYLAETITLFHDIGRFKQFKTYGTFDDRKSENHAALGVKILKETGVLSCLSEHEQNLICKAVEYHNLPELPDNESADCLLFSKLIRDADKLDIWNIFTNHYETGEHPNSVLEIELSDAPNYSEEFIGDILNCRISKIHNLKTYNDMKLLRLTLIFDVNFPFTFSCIVKRRYLEKTINSLPDNKDIREVYSHLKTYLEKRKRR